MCDDAYSKLGWARGARHPGKYILCCCCAPQERGQQANYILLARGKKRSAPIIVVVVVCTRFIFFYNVQATMRPGKERSNLGGTMREDNF